MISFNRLAAALLINVKSLPESTIVLTGLSLIVDVMIVMSFCLIAAFLLLGFFFPLMAINAGAAIAFKPRIVLLPLLLPMLLLLFRASCCSFFLHTRSKCPLVLQ